MQWAVKIAAIKIAAARSSNSIALMQDPTEAHRVNPPETHCSSRHGGALVAYKSPDIPANSNEPQPSPGAPLAHSVGLINAVRPAVGPTKPEYQI